MYGSHGLADAVHPEKSEPAAHDKSTASVHEDLEESDGGDNDDPEVEPYKLVLQLDNMAKQLDLTSLCGGREKISVIQWRGPFATVTE